MVPAPELQAKEIDPQVETLFQMCLARHDEFDKTVWQGKDSFHNRHHVLANFQAAEKLIEAAQVGNDPLHIKSDIDKIWGEGKWTWDEFHEATKLAYGFHDQGNIAELTAAGQINFLPGYRAVGAEDRSIKIAEREIQKSSIDWLKRGKYLDMVPHLIGHTRFVPDGELAAARQIPLHTFVHAVDWGGTNFFNLNPRNSFGLAREIYTETGDINRVGLSFWRRTYNFPWYKLHLIFAESEAVTRDALIEIWGARSKFKDESKTPEFFVKMAKGWCYTQRLKRNL